MKNIICMVLVVLIFLSLGFAQESYISEFGSEFETGQEEQEEQEDAIVDTLNEYYVFYKNTTYFKIVLDENSKITFQLENGKKDYQGILLDNRFHNLQFILNTRLSQIWSFDLGIKYGETVNEYDDFNSYLTTKLEPKIIANIYTWRIFSSIGWQIKEFENRKQNNLIELKDTTQAITDLSWNFGVDKQITSNGYLKFKYKYQLLNQDDLIAAGDQKTVHNAKIAYVWKR